MEYIENFLRFALRQIHLQKIKCISRTKMSDEMVNLLMSFIVKIPKLLALCLSLDYNDIVWKVKWLEDLSASCLETLQIVCNEIDCSTISECPYPSCAVLSNLKMEGDKLDIIPLLKFFPRLKSLQLSHVDDEMLECICSNHVNYIMAY